MATDIIARALAASSVRVLAQSAVPVSHTGDTNEFTLATITVPAWSMGANGQIVVEAHFSNTNNANTKTFKIKFGGTAFITQNVTATATGSIRARICNRNATNSQIAAPIAGGFGTSANANATGAIDTTADTTVTITGQCVTAGTDTVTLESYEVTLMAKG